MTNKNSKTKPLKKVSATNVKSISENSDKIPETNFTKKEWSEILDREQSEAVAGCIMDEIMTKVSEKTLKKFKEMNEVSWVVERIRLSILQMFQYSYAEKVKLMDKELWFIINENNNNIEPEASTIDNYADGCISIETTEKEPPIPLQELTCKEPIRGTENDIVYEAMTCQVEESSETQLRRELIENDVVANKDFVLRSKLKKLKYPFKKENIQIIQERQFQTEFPIATRKALPPLKNKKNKTFGFDSRESGIHSKITDNYSNEQKKMRMIMLSRMNQSLFELSQQSGKARNPVLPKLKVETTFSIASALKLHKSPKPQQKLRRQLSSWELGNQIEPLKQLVNQINVSPRVVVRQDKTLRTNQLWLSSVRMKSGARALPISNYQRILQSGAIFPDVAEAIQHEQSSYSHFDNTSSRY